MNLLERVQEMRHRTNEEHGLGGKTKTHSSKLGVSRVHTVRTQDPISGCPAPIFGIPVANCKSFCV